MEIYSHSKLSTFEQCPLKYKFRYIDKIKPEIKQTIEGFLGNKVHDVLEWIYIEAAKGRVIELDEIIQKYAEAWHKDLNEEIKVVKVEFSTEDYFNKGVQFLVNYFLRNNPFRDNTLATEKKIVLDLDEQGEFKLQGYIDRLVHNKEENIFEIHDYKTSSSMKTQEELDKDRQLALYSMGIKKLFPEVKDIHLIWHFLAFDKKMVSKRSDEQLEELRKEIIELIKKIRTTKEFPPIPGVLCRWCEFQGHCPEIKDKSPQSSLRRFL